MTGSGRRLRVPRVSRAPLGAPRAALVALMVVITSASACSSAAPSVPGSTPIAGQGSQPSIAPTGTSTGLGPSGSPAGTSDDQSLTLAANGPPPFFTVTFATAGGSSPGIVRRDTWIYPDQGAAFVFDDGKYQFSRDVQPPASNSGTSTNAALTPDQVRPDLTVAQLGHLLGRQPAVTIGLSADLLAGGMWCDFGSGVVAVFVNDQLLEVQVAPAMTQ